LSIFKPGCEIFNEGINIMTYQCLNHIPIDDNQKYRDRVGGNRFVGDNDGLGANCEKKEGRLGIVYMDFPGDGLIKSIIDSNAVFFKRTDLSFQVQCETFTTTLTGDQKLTPKPGSFFTNTGPGDIIFTSPFREIIVSPGETKKIGASCGDASHEPPTIGKNLAGTQQMVNNGFCIDADCFTVTKLFHEEFKLYEMMSGTHTLSTLVYCAQGVEHCNYSAIGIMPYDKDMNDAVWKIEMKGNHLGEWTPVIYDPEGFLGEVTITTQIISDNFLSVSYTIEFKNKQTPPMKVGVQLRDDKNGVRNFYFNEGIQLNDSDAYPYVETAFEEPIKVEMPCINPQPHDRDSCGFELVRDWTQKNAQELLNDMQNGNYIYDKYVRDRYYD